MEYTATCNTFYSTCTEYVGKKIKKAFDIGLKSIILAWFRLSKCLMFPNVWAYILLTFPVEFAMAYFISTCAVLWFDRNYIGEIPLVFVFGIATSVSAVHRLLPNAVSSMLCMEKFQAPPSTEYLNMVINQVRHSRYLPLWLTH